MAQSVAQAKRARTGRQQTTTVPPVVGNSYFKVYFGSTLLSFARVKNIQRAVETEQLAEGGLNDFVHVLTKPGTQGGKLNMEKGVVADGAVIKTLRSLAPGTRINVPVTITLCHRTDKEWKPVRSWGFEDGMVTSWELSDLDGLGSEVAIERLEIAHAGLVELEV